MTQEETNSIVIDGDSRDIVEGNMQQVESADTAVASGNNVQSTDSTSEKTSEVFDKSTVKNATNSASGATALCVLIVGVLDSVSSAMPFWCVAAITLGFGAFLVFPVPLIMYIILSCCTKHDHILEVCGRVIYVLMKVVGFIIGQIVGVLLVIVLPFVSLGSNSASMEMVILSYAACMIGALVCARIIQNSVEKVN